MARVMHLTLAVAALMLCATSVVAQVSGSSVKEVDLKVLILGTVPTTDATLTGIKTSLDSRGMPYEYINVLIGYQNNEPLPLVDVNGRGRFYAIVKTSRDLAYEAAPGYWPSALSNEQWLQIELYQQEFSVRALSLHSWPFFNGATHYAAGSTAFVQFTLEHQQLDPGVKENMRADLVGSYVTPAALNDAPGFTATSYLYDDDDLSSLPNGVGSAVYKSLTGVETWHYFFIPTAYYAGQVATLSVGVQWVTKGMYLGKRRVWLSMQIDDLFLATPEWEDQYATVEDDDVKQQVRITAADMQLLADYSKKVSEELPEGSQLRYEWAFNGEGVVENGGYGVDPLSLQSVTNVDDFWWVTHTYTHPFLDDYTYEQCKVEMADNWAAAASVWGSPLPSAIDTSSMVNPAITGLFNGPCLQAIKDEGVTTVVGDNSRAELLPQTYGGSTYHGLWTTQEVNGNTGVFIVPRWATNIFFDNSLPENNIAHFNHITPYEWTWEQLMAYEGSTAARNAMQYRPDPYMFHQANVASFNWPGWTSKASLMALWTQSVVDELNKYNAFPVRSARQSTMRAELEERMARDECGISAYAVVESGVATRVHATSSGKCKLALSGISGSQLMEAETYGTQWGGERTVFADMEPGQEVVIDTGLNAGPTCPIANGALCGGNGYCDASIDPPACLCAAGWSGEDCTTQVFDWGDNLLPNGDFTKVLNQLAVNWGVFANGYTIGLDAATGNTWATMNNPAGAGASSGAYQFLAVNQKYATSLRITGRSRATGVTGTKDADYAVYVDVVHEDGSWQYGVTAQFTTGTHDWEIAEVAFTPSKPVAFLWVYCMFRNHDGIAEFDDVAVQEEVPLPATYGEPTEDGRCGSNSPTNAGCPAESPCCSTYGWCGSGAGHCTYTGDDGKVEEEVVPRTCGRCGGGTSGECKHPDGWCMGLVGGKCPGGTLPCDGVSAFSVGSGEGHLVALLDVGGIEKDAFSPDITARFEKSVADSLNVGSDDVHVVFVEKLHSEDGTQKSEVQVVVTGDSVGDLAVRLQDAVDDGTLETNLAGNHIGVEANMNGDARVVGNGGDGLALTGSGIGIALMAGLAAVALALGVALGAVAMRRSQRGRRTRVTTTNNGQWKTNDRVLVRVNSSSAASDGDSDSGSVNHNAFLAINNVKPQVANSRASSRAGSRASSRRSSGASDYSENMSLADQRKVSQRQMVYQKSAMSQRAAAPTSGPELFGTVTPIREVAGHRVADC